MNTLSRLGAWCPGGVPDFTNPWKPYCPYSSIGRAIDL